MIKKRFFPPSYDFKTGVFYRLSLFLGFILLFIFIFLKLGSMFIDVSDASGFFRWFYDVSHSTVSESIVALAVICIGVGVILFFLHYQFVKLSEIAEEVEKGEL